MTFGRDLTPLPAIQLSLREEVSVTENTNGSVILECPWRHVTLRQVGPGLRAALKRLAFGPTCEDELADLVLDVDGGAALPELYYRLQQFDWFCFLRYSVALDEQSLVAVVPMTPALRVTPKLASVGSKFRLSRFTYCRRDGDRMVLECPLSTFRAILGAHPAPALVAELSHPRTPVELATRLEGVDEDTARAFLGMLAWAGMVAEVTDEGLMAEDRCETLVQWDFHELLFHVRSRPGRHDLPIGPTFSFVDRITPLPAVKASMSGETVPLYKPDLDAVSSGDPPFTAVLEGRKSIREYGKEPMTARQLGEFLYRTARVRELIEPDPERLLYYQASSRPYPSGGAAYDLELYIVVNQCRDLAAGVYHYQPSDQTLQKLTDPNPHSDRLLLDAQNAAALFDLPQVLIVLTSRFQRLSWKYSGVAYAMTLKNAGVLYQTMYLVATAMGLSPCGLGIGNPSVFAEAIGLDFFEESSVGEFLLGSSADPPSA